MLTNADVDHIAGLLNLRESQPLRLYATERVLSVLEANPVFNVLNPAFVSREPMRLDEPLSILCPDGSPTGVVVTPFAVPGKGRAVARRPKARVRTSAPWRKTPSPWR